MCLSELKFLSFSMWFTVSPPFRRLDPEALVRSLVPQQIHQSRPPVSADRGHSQGMGNSVWNTQQDPLRTRQCELDKAVKVLGMSVETVPSVRGGILEHQSWPHTDLL